MTTTNNKKLSILFLAADKFPPFRVDVSVLFAKELVGRGHTIDWLLQSEKPLDRAIVTSWEGGRAWVGKTDIGPSLWSRAKLHFHNVLNDCKMFSLMAFTPYDMVIVRDKFIAGVLAVIASKLFKTKFFYWLSFPFDEDPFFRVKEKTVQYPLLYVFRGIITRMLLYRIIIPKCTHALVQTEYMKVSMIKKGASPVKMTAVPMAVSIKNTSFFGHLQNYSISNRCPNVVYLGTLIKIRRMDFLIRTFKLVLDRIKNAKLFLVGSSRTKADEEELLQEAEKLGIGHAVTITGFLSQKKAWDYVKNADVCVSPIYPSPIFDVGSPTKLLEYMAMGKAAVANDQPEQRAVLEESGAGICVPYDETAFSEAIIFIIQNQAIAHQMGIRGRKYIEEKRRYSRTADQLEQVLLRMTGNNRTMP